MKNQYSNEFKVRALRYYLSCGKSAQRTAAEFSIPESTVVYWVSVGYERIFRRYMDDVQGEVDSIGRLKAQIASLENKNRLLGRMLVSAVRDIMNAD